MTEAYRLENERLAAAWYAERERIEVDHAWGSRHGWTGWGLAGASAAAVSVALLLAVTTGIA